MSIIADLNKKILVTGGAGFIGCAISRILAPGAERYVVMDNLHPQIHAKPVRPEDLDAKAELVVADATDSSAWDQVLSQFKPQIIVHLAAETGTGQSLTEASRHGLVNVVGTTQLTDALGRHQISPEHILLTSSRAVYGEGPWMENDGQLCYPGQRTRIQLEASHWDFSNLKPCPVSASLTHPMPSSVYGATKLTQEQILSAWCLSTKVPLSILRLQNVYGPGQSLTNSYTGIVALFSRLAKQGQVIPLYEDGQVVRDFVFIEDVVSGVAAALARPPVDKRVCDVGSGVATTIQQMAQSVANYYQAPTPLVCGKFRDGDVRFAACNIEPTVSSLGWRPVWSLDQGIDSLQKWINAELGK